MYKKLLKSTKLNFLVENFLYENPLYIFFKRPLEKDPPVKDKISGGVKSNSF